MPAKYEYLCRLALDYQIDLTEEDKKQISDSFKDYIEMYEEEHIEKPIGGGSDDPVACVVAAMKSDKFLSLAHKFNKLQTELGRDFLLTRRSYCCGSCGLDFIDDDDTIFYATSSSQSPDSYYDPEPTVSFDIIGTLNNSPIDSFIELLKSHALRCGLLAEYDGEDGELCLRDDNIVCLTDVDMRITYVDSLCEFVMSDLYTYIQI